MSLKIDRIGPAAVAGGGAEAAGSSRHWRAAALGDVAAAPYLYVALLALMTAPVLIWPIPNAADIVNHWARLTILGMSAGDPLSALYTVKFAIIPNLGVDGLYLALSPVLSPQSVTRLAWALAIWLPAWGAWRLHRALFAEPQLAILLIPAISYNLVVTVGLVNFGFGMGIALLALAWRVASDRRPFWVGLVALNLVSVILMFCHALALLAFCVAFGLLEITPRRAESWRLALLRGALAPLHVAMGLVLLGFAERTPAGFDLVAAKSLIFEAPFLASTDYDHLVRSAVVTILAVAAWKRRLSVAPRMACTLAAFAAIILVMPSSWGAGNLFDARLTVFWAYLAVASLGWAWTGRFGRLSALALVVLSLARFVSVLPAWSLFEREAEAMRSVIATIAPGARVLVVKPPRETCVDPDMPMLNNLTALVVIDRRAMVNTLFADPGMQPVRPSDPALEAAPKMAMSSRWLRPEDRRGLGPVLRLPWADAFIDWRDHFDTVLSLHGRCDGRLDVPGLEQVGVSSVADVYRAR
jgi:hypothetical protein